jgi:hypothetical protein
MVLVIADAEASPSQLCSSAYLPNECVACVIEILRAAIEKRPSVKAEILIEQAVHREKMTSRLLRFFSSLEADLSSKKT